MDWKFDFLGIQEGKKYFCIITDDGTNRGMGLSVCYHYYLLNEDRSMKSLSYDEVPSFNEKPSKLEANRLMDQVTRFFHGWIPYHMRIVNEA